MTFYGPPQLRLHCRAVARMLQAYLDGELAEPMASLVAQHLDLCLRCGLDADTWRWLKRNLGGLARAEDPDRLTRLQTFVDDLLEQP